MDQAMIMEIMTEALMTAFKLSAPVLVLSMAVGLVISILQAATQIHEQTLTFVPKLLAIGISLIVLGPWMGEVMTEFTTTIFQIIGAYT